MQTCFVKSVADVFWCVCVLNLHISQLCISFVCESPFFPAAFPSLCLPPHYLILHHALHSTVKNSLLPYYRRKKIYFFKHWQGSKLRWHWVATVKCEWLLCLGLDVFLPLPWDHSVLLALDLGWIKFERYQKLLNQILLSCFGYNYHPFPEFFTSMTGFIIPVIKF